MPILFNRATGALLLAILTSIPARATEAAPSNLQGNWKLNADLTKRIRASESRREHDVGGPGGRRPGGPPGGGGPGGPPGGGGPGGPPGGGGPGRTPPGGGFPGGGPRGGEGPGAAPPALDAFDELTIVQTASSVAITDHGGLTRTLPTDGSKVREEEGPGGPATLRARWTKEGALEVRIKPDEGEKRTESYVASNDGEHLYLTIVFSGRGDFPLRLAYDRVRDAPAEPPSPEP